MTERTRASWLVYALGALCAGAIVAAILVVGPASGSQTAITRTATVARGIVQSTVSGTGNLQPASQLNLGFGTSGTVTHIYVSQGQDVTQGQLLATLDPQSAEVTLEQSKASLQAAEANLAKEDETDGESSAGAGSGSGSGSTGAATASSATTGTGATTTHASTEGGSNSASGTPISTATREANIASARAAVRSDRVTVQSDERAVEDTQLYAPQSGTIAALSGQVGEVVSASGTTRATSASAGASGSGSGSGSGATGAGASSTRASTGASTSSGSSGSTTSAFAVLADLSSMQLVVPLSESEIGDVTDGQIATVTVEALEGRKLAAHVSDVAILSTSNSGVVSYDVTFQLDQLDPGLKPGMSATAEVVVKQAEGISVPTSAISAGTVSVMRGGKEVRQRVVTGLAGNSSTIVLSGLTAGETVVLPTPSTTGAASLTSRLGRVGSGPGGLGGGGLAGAGAFLRGGG
jgi:multidrug efflux pump subunit AcrA (membrane-fusion protein)